MDDLLRMKDDVRHAFDRVLPEYASTVMVADLQTAFRVAESHPEANFLTVSGEAYSPRGKLSAAADRKPMAGFLALKREKRELSSKLAALRKKMQSVQEEVAGYRKEQASVAESLKSLATQVHDLELELITLGHKVTSYESDIEKLDRTESVAAGELAQLQVEKSDYETKLRHAAETIQEIERIDPRAKRKYGL